MVTFDENGQPTCEDADLYVNEECSDADSESEESPAENFTACTEPETDVFGIIPPEIDAHLAWAPASESDGSMPPLDSDADSDADAAVVPLTRDKNVRRALANSHLSRPAPHTLFSSVLSALPPLRFTLALIFFFMLGAVMPFPLAAKPSLHRPILPRLATAYKLETAAPSAQSPILDSGSTRNASGDISRFPDNLVQDRRPNLKVKVASGVKLRVAFIGVMLLTVRPHDVMHPSGQLSTKPLQLRLPNSLYVPGLCATLVSTKSLFKDQQVRTYFNDELRLVLPDSRHIRIHETPTNYILRLAEPPLLSAFNAQVERARGPSSIPKTRPAPVHARLAHFSYERINDSIGKVKGLSKRLQKESCDACFRGGSHKPPTQKSTQRRYAYFGERIASDLCKMPTSTPFGFSYMLCFYDLATKYVEIYYLRTGTADEVKACFKHFLIENKPFLKGRQVTWYTDNGSEFFEKNLDKFLEEFEIRHKSIPPYNPQQNPAERVWRLVLRPLRICLAASNADPSLWPWAVNQIVAIHNSLITRSETAIDRSTPYEMKTGREPDVSLFRPLFCQVMCHLRGDQKQIEKLAPRVTEGIHLGIDRSRGGYFVYLTEINRLTTVRFGDVSFNEEVMPHLGKIHGTYVSYTTRYSLPSVSQQEDWARRSTETNEPPLPLQRPNAPAALPQPSQGDDRGEGPPSRRLRSSGYRHQALPALAVVSNEPYIDDYIPLAEIADTGLTLHLASAASSKDVLPPPTKYSDIAGRPDEEEWRAATVSEYRGKIANDTFELVKRPEGKLVCKTKWVFTNKLGTDQTLQERKARWVLCGYSQIPGVHFTHTFTATAKSVSIRIFFAFVAFFSLELLGIDVIKAFTHADIDTEIYCEQPEGFVQLEKKSKEKLVCRLKKALEGGRQSGYLWQTRNSKSLKNFGFKQCVFEPCIFLLRRGESIIIILVWIDDLAIAYRGKALMEEFIQTYAKDTKVKPASELTKFLGMKITRDRSAKTISLSQEAYIENMADRFLPTSSLRKHVSTPAWYTDKAERKTTYSDLSVAKNERDSAVHNGKPFLELIASILYACTMTRPDIAFHTSALCRYMHNPSLACYARAEELLNYLFTTKSKSITYGGHEIIQPVLGEMFDESAKAVAFSDISRRLNENYGLHIFSDASWKTDGTYLAFIVKFANGPIDWSSRLLKVSASSCQAETGAGCLAAKRNVFVRNVINELLTVLGLTLQGGATLLFMDNYAAIQQAAQNGTSKKTEHYKRWEYTLREEHLEGRIKPVFVRTVYQLADALTKVLSKTTFVNFLKNVFA